MIAGICSFKKIFLLLCKIQIPNLELMAWFSSKLFKLFYFPSHNPQESSFSFCFLVKIILCTSRLFHSNSVDNLIISIIGNVEIGWETIMIFVLVKNT